MRFVSSFVLAFVVGLAMASNKAEASFVTIGDVGWVTYNVACAGQAPEDAWDCGMLDNFYSFSNFFERTAETDGAIAVYTASGSVIKTSATNLVTGSTVFTETAFSFANDDSVFAFAAGSLKYFGLTFDISEDVDAFFELDLTQTQTFYPSFYLSGTDQEFSGNIFSGLLSPGTYGFSFVNDLGFSVSSLSGADIGGLGVASSGVGSAFSSSSSFFNFSFARVYAVPEPHTAMMLGLGLVTLALARRRQSMRTLS